MNPEQIYAANHAPIAPYTWDVRADLPTAVESTARIPVAFQRPVEIVGAFATVTALLPLAGGGLVVPTVDNVDVRVDMNNQDRFTNRLEGGAVAGAPGQTQVPLAAMSTQVPRLLRIQAVNAAPDFGFEFSWRQFAPGGLFEAARISLTLFCRFLGPREVAEIRARYGN